MKPSGLTGRGAAIASHRAELLADPDTPVGANPAGDVTVVEFFDYHCAYCKSVAPVLTGLADEDPNVRVVYKELPILGAESLQAAYAALAAHRQGKYVAVHGALMKAQGRLTSEILVRIAGGLGLDVDRLRNEMAAPATRAVVEQNRALARTLGVTGTPAFVIGAELVPGATDVATLRGLVARTRDSSRAGPQFR